MKWANLLGACMMVEKNLRKLYQKAFSLVSPHLSIEDVYAFIALLREFAVGPKGLRHIIGTFENSIDPNNDSTLSREFNAALNKLLKTEIDFITSEVRHHCAAVAQMEAAVKERMIQDLENIGLSFSGLIEVGSQFNSILIYHNIPHSLDVASLSALSAEASGPSWMLKAAAEGAYHDSRMTFLPPHGILRKAGVGSDECEGASGEALIQQLECIRGRSLSDKEKYERKLAINRTVPEYHTMAADSLGTVVNATMLENDIPAIFQRRDLLTHDYKQVDGLEKRLTELAQKYLKEGLKEIEAKIQLVKQFSVGLADLGDVLYDPKNWIKTGAVGTWSEIFRQDAYDLINYEQTSSQPDGEVRIDTAISNLISWMTVKQPAFARGMATFREECNYYPMVALKRALEMLHTQTKNEAQVARIEAARLQIGKEIAVFEKLYFVNETHNPAILFANQCGWNIKEIRREAVEMVASYALQMKQSTPLEVAKQLADFYVERTGGRRPAHEGVVLRFIEDNMTRIPPHTNT